MIGARRRERSVTVVCVPGGGSTAAGTFDAHVPGHSDYSFVEAMAQRGIAFELVDLPGVDDPAIDGDTVSLDGAAVSLATTVSRLRRRLAAEAVVIGVGHSLGGGVVSRAANAFDGIALLGYSPRWSSLPADPSRPSGADVAAVRAWTAARLSELDPGLWLTDRVVFPQSLRDGFAILPDAPDDVALAAIADSVPVPRGLAVDHGIVEPALTAAGRVAVPTLLVFGAVDAAAEPLDEAVAYWSAASVDTIVLTGSGHAHHFSPARHRLWAELDAWISRAVISAPLERTAHV